MVRTTAIATVAALLLTTPALAQNLTYDEWYAEVQKVAVDEDWEPFSPAFPEMFEQGVSPQEAYDEDTFQRLEYENLEFEIIEGSMNTK